tara:strand:+ start:126 stop:737 length:612 start_codon:yes stop_codon:yes gene_type:complete
MCGRFSVDIDDKELLHRFPNHNVQPFQKISNFAPTMELPIFLEKDVINMKWGLIPHWAKDSTFASKLINARGETLLDKASFKDLVDTQRCLIISNGFYEWDSKSKKPYFIHSKDNPLMNYCGLYSIWMDNNFQSVLTFTIITIEANNTLSKIHHRMPVILDEGNETKWLDSNNNFQSVRELIKPIDDSKIEMSQIDLNYNNNN